MRVLLISSRKLLDIEHKRHINLLQIAAANTDAKPGAAEERRSLYAAVLARVAQRRQIPKKGDIYGRRSRYAHFVAVAWSRPESRLGKHSHQHSAATEHLIGQCTAQWQQHDSELVNRRRRLSCAHSRALASNDRAT